MKKLITLFAAAALGFALIGCAKTEDAAATDTAGATTGTTAATTGTTAATTGTTAATKTDGE